MRIIFIGMNNKEELTGVIYNNQNSYHIERFIEENNSFIKSIHNKNNIMDCLKKDTL